MKDAILFDHTASIANSVARFLHRVLGRSVVANDARGEPFDQSPSITT